MLPVNQFPTISFNLNQSKIRQDKELLIFKLQEMTKYKKEVQVSIPEAHDLGFCSINTVSQFPFTIFNPNSKPVSYKFKYTEFNIVPSKGAIMPNSVANFKIEFKPTCATVIVGTVVLEVEGEPQRVYRLSAVGKYPYISVKEQLVEFDNVLVTKPTSKDVYLKNSSEVPAAFRIVGQQSEFPDNFFSIQPSEGVIPPKMNFKVKFLYTPWFCDHDDLSKFKMICESGNQIDIKCQGKSKRFAVSLSTQSLNFGQIKLESFSNKVISLTNTSELDTQFEFFTDTGNIFSFSETKGIIQRQSAKKIIIEFRPRNTIAYYERVYCLVRNHSLLFVDLIGTCYDLLIRPIPLVQTHIDIFRKRVIEGRISQIQLKYVENNALLRLARRREMGEDYNSVSEQNFYQTANLALDHPFVLHKQLFLQGKNNELIKISDDCIEFGFCDVMTMSGQRQIEIVNRMQCKLSLFWVNQKRQNLNGEYMTVFQIYPESATLKPNVPVKFNLTFRPLKSGAFFFQNLQFFAIKYSQKISKKTLEDFQYKDLKSKPENTLLRNVKLNQTIQTRVKQELEMTEVFPPLAGVVRCSGHSFSQTTMPYLPIMKVQPSKGVTFKPCLINESVYESVKLSNPSDTPVYFKVGPDPTKVFRVFPKIGLIQPKSFCVVAIQFNPTDYKTYKSVLNVTLNDMPGSSNVKIPLLGICTAPEIKIENDGQLFFAPTSVGVYTKKTIFLQNCSKTNVLYKIVIPEKHQNQLYFDPPEKQLLPNQKLDLNAYFTPSLKKKYKFKIPIQVSEVSSAIDMGVGYYLPGSGVMQKDDRELTKKIFQIEVIGEGSDCCIQISEESINFGAVKITENKKLKVKIKNTSDCAFYADVCLKNWSQEQAETQQQITNSFKLDFKGGVIPANSEIDVGITFAPIKIANFDLKLIVSAKDRAPKKIPLKTKSFDSVVKSVMKVQAQGNYPQMEIIDIRNDTLSVAALWENFQISQINKAMNTGLSKGQKMFLNIQNLTFNETKDLESNLSRYDWNLGYVSAKSKDKPRKVIITVKNFGGTALNYVFKFPSDNKIHEELWADPGEPSEEEAYEKAIIDKKIFQIKPKVGHLEPGEVKDIELIYSPTALDFTKNSNTGSQLHELKVVFQIENGKSLVFNLKGTTLGPNQGLLTVKKTHYELPYTPIGLITPLRFPIQLSNVGSIKVTYKAEIEYEQEEFQNVFGVENSSNFLIPGESTYIYCIYKPLVRKQYSFKVHIEIFDFAKAIQKITLYFSGDARDATDGKQGKKVAIHQSIPRQRTSVSEVGSKAFFSIEDVDFGSMKALSTKYKMIIMYNMSKVHALNFDFASQTSHYKNGLTCGDKFVIEPSSGTLQPDNFLQLKLTLTSVSQPSTYEGQIACNIVWALNTYNSDDNDATMKQTALTAKKQTLFLRISKSTNLQGNIPSIEPFKAANTDKRSLIQIVFGNIVNDVLNDPALNSDIAALESEHLSLCDELDAKDPVWLGLTCEDPENFTESKKDYEKHENLFLLDQFKEITELIMENTFFNIVQETTHKENDFLRVAKKFIHSNQSNV